MIDDKRFNVPGGRMGQYNTEFRAAIDKALGTRSTDDVVAELNRLDIPAAPVLPLAQAWRQPQVQHNAATVERYNEKLGTNVREVRLAPQFSGTPTPLSAPAPLYGEHSEEVLRELGYSEAELSEFLAGGVVRNGFRFGQ